MYYDDAKELERRLLFESHGNEEKIEITRIEADILNKCLNHVLKDHFELINE